MAKVGYCSLALRGTRFLWRIPLGEVCFFLN